MTVDTFKLFLNSTLLEQFPDVENPSEDAQYGEPPLTTIEPNPTIKNAVEVANKSYSALIARMPTKAVVRFDSDTFCLKTALCFIYEYVLQDHAMLHSLSLQTMSLSEDQIFNNYFALLKAEREDLNEMRKEALKEIEDKETDTKNQGVMLFHRYPRNSGGRLW